MKILEKYLVVVIFITIIYTIIFSMPTLSKNNIENISDIIEYIETHNKVSNDYFNLFERVIYEYKGKNDIQDFKDLVDLLNYDFDAGNPFLQEVISEKGENILPFLYNKLYTGTVCKNKLYCRKLECRNNDINIIIESIYKGTVLYQQFPDDLYKIALFDIELINIMIKKYNDKEGNSPENIEALKDWCWSKYHYDLRIYDPWGDKYTLEKKGEKIEVKSKDLDKWIKFSKNGTWK